MRTRLSLATRAPLPLWVAPTLIALVTGLAVARVWGSLHETTSIFHDEAAYLLQARIFASGRWTAPGRQLPEFFEQFHVLVSPVLAAKYWPGHSLLLIPGIWLGAPNLVPIVLTAAAGGLFYGLTRRVLTAGVALIAWFVWLTSRSTLFFQTTYLSEITTGLLWLASLWALLEWRSTRRTLWLVVLSSCVAWGGITRPLTMLALSLPIAAIVLRDLVRLGAWRQVVPGVVPVVLVLSLVPLWSARTTGDWRRTPYTEYLRLYFPFDRLGFAFDSTPPARALPPEMVKFASEMSVPFREHTVRALPQILGRRLKVVGEDMWGGDRIALLPLAVLGILLSPWSVRFALGSAILLVLAYLPYGFTSRWSLYYLEIQPALALVTAIGAWRAAQLIATRLTKLPSAFRAIGAIYLLAALAYVALRVENFRQVRRFMIAPKIAFAHALDRISGPAVVFVRYGANHSVHTSLIENSEDLTKSRVWVVRDLGPENRRLIQMAAGRVPYLYDQEQGRLHAIDHQGAPMRVEP